MQFCLAETLKDLSRQNRIRFIASSTVDLAYLVANGGFLRDLLNIFSGICINMPSLSQRKEDIPALATIYINQFNAEFNREVIGIEGEAFTLLKEFNWVLNLDQLRSVIRQLVFCSSSYYITKQDVETVLRETEIQYETGKKIDLSRSLDQIEEDIIWEVLQQENMNQSSAAKRLGISRSTLWRKVKLSKLP